MGLFGRKKKNAKKPSKLVSTQPKPFFEQEMERINSIQSPEESISELSNLFGIIDGKWNGSLEVLVDGEGNFKVNPDYIERNPPFSRLKPGAHAEFDQETYLWAVGSLAMFDDKIVVLENESNPEYVGIAPTILCTGFKYDENIAVVSNLSLYDIHPRITTCDYIYHLYATNKRLILFDNGTDTGLTVFFRPNIKLNNSKSPPKIIWQDVTDTLHLRENPYVSDIFTTFNIHPKTTITEYGYQQFIILPTTAIVNRINDAIQKSEPTTLEEGAIYSSLVKNIKNFPSET